MKKDEYSVHISGILEGLPQLPGVYQFFNEKEEIIYIGKAKNLKRRVSSYFQKQQFDNAKLRILVRKICDLKYIVVDSESDALLLENNLIKKYKPRYNILLKDDKTFPWICITNERFPRVYSTRTVTENGSVYFGPYTSAVMVRTLLELFKHLFPIRSCALNLTETNIQSGKFKVCLEYHLHNCLAPCIGEQKEDDYLLSIEQMKNVLKGNLQQVIGYLKDKMKEQAESFAFEAADQFKGKIEMLEKFKSKSTIVNPSIHNVDVFSLVMDRDMAVVNFLKVINGSIIQAHTVELVNQLVESKEDLLEFALIDIRDRFHSEANEIILPFPLEFDIKGITFTIPKIGDKRKLLDLSERNARYYLLERARNLEKINPDIRVNRIMETMKNDLHLSELPVHIECFDNSNIQGSDPVASCVVFRNGKPFKSEYRHFNIKTVTGPDDFASMEEIVYRRYKRMMDENTPLPQLIVIDGGKGQLHAAVNSLNKLGLYGKVGIIGIAKRLEEIYFPGDTIPLYLDKLSESLKVIQLIRNEAHRFGITFHRNKRSQGMIGSVLESIPGIGSKTMELLYLKYGSISAIKEVPIEVLIELIGKKRAAILGKYFAELK